MSRVAKDSYVLLGTLSIAKGKRIGAVAQLMESIDQSDSSFASIKSFSSLQKMQKKNGNTNKGFTAPRIRALSYATLFSQKLVP